MGISWPHYDTRLVDQLAWVYRSDLVTDSRCSIIIIMDIIVWQQKMTLYEIEYLLCCVISTLVISILL